MTAAVHAASRGTDAREGGFDLEQHVQGIEREYIMEALRRSNGVKKNAAELLGLSFRQFRYLLKKYNIQYSARRICQLPFHPGRLLRIRHGCPEPSHSRRRTSEASASCQE